MRRLATLLPALLFLASCAPGTATTPGNLHASQGYAEKVSENHFRVTSDLFEDEKPATVVVPIRAGETFLFKDSEVITGKIQAFHRRVDRQDNAIVYDRTSKFEQASLRAPENWGVRLASIQKRVDFDASVKTHPKLRGAGVVRVDMGGNVQTKKQGILAFIELVEVSVPLDVQPGRYLVKAQYKHRSERKSLEFIVEVL